MAPDRHGVRSRVSSWSRSTRAYCGRTISDAERRLPVLTTLTGRLLAARIMEAGTRLAAQIFLTAVPLLFIVAATAPYTIRNNLLHSVRAVFGLNGASAEQLQELYATDGGDLREGTSVIGTLIVLLSATSSSRALARICQRAWGLGAAPTRVAIWRWFAWLLTWLLVLTLQGPVRSGFGAGLWLGVPLSFLSGVCIWWWSQHLLLAGRMPWLPLLPAAVLAAAATSALSITAHLYIPRALNRSLAEYGPLGSVFTLLSWLVAVCVVLTAALTIGAVLAKETFLARYLGTPVDDPPVRPPPRDGRGQAADD
ncbi:ribonuclease BN [Kitasatospora kifunensis]|uniref:Membrane protein n=1 Tax=Kitasatospora kifunensis TaxID=58351 RepID=A0A7W7QXL1_KITKI|nr:ribonuclease BN [Kitasatospora kifunensis]MBB4921530.1 membrane protein [Kitasatospora kifunensis]